MGPEQNPINVKIWEFYKNDYTEILLKSVLHVLEVINKTRSIYVSKVKNDVIDLFYSVRPKNSIIGNSLELGCLDSHGIDSFESEEWNSQYENFNKSTFSLIAESRDENLNDQGSLSSSDFYSKLLNFEPLFRRKKQGKYSKNIILVGKDFYSSESENVRASKMSERFDELIENVLLNGGDDVDQRILEDSVSDKAELFMDFFKLIIPLFYRYGRICSKYECVCNSNTSDKHVYEKVMNNSSIFCSDCSKKLLDYNPDIFVEPKIIKFPVAFKDYNSKK